MTYHANRPCYAGTCDETCKCACHDMAMGMTYHISLECGLGDHDRCGDPGCDCTCHDVGVAA